LDKIMANQPVTISGVGHVSAGDTPSTPYQMEFKDGTHTIPEAVVAHLGGTEEVKKFDGKFKDKTFPEFMSAFWKLIEKDQLNKAANEFISSHMMMRNLNGELW